MQLHSKEVLFDSGKDDTQHSPVGSGKAISTGVLSRVRGMHE